MTENGRLNGSIDQIKLGFVDAQKHDALLFEPYLNTAAMASTTGYK
jgi:hypothetical protein